MLFQIATRASLAPFVKMVIDQFGYWAPMIIVVYHARSVQCCARKFRGRAGDVALRALSSLIVCTSARHLNLSITGRERNIEWRCPCTKPGLVSLIAIPHFLNILKPECCSKSVIFRNLTGFLLLRSLKLSKIKIAKIRNVGATELLCPTPPPP